MISLRFPPLILYFINVIFLDYCNIFLTLINPAVWAIPLPTIFSGVFLRACPQSAVAASYSNYHFSSGLRNFCICCWFNHRSRKRWVFGRTHERVPQRRRAVLNDRLWHSYMLLGWACALCDVHDHVVLDVSQVSKKMILINSEFNHNSIEI